MNPTTTVKENAKGFARDVPICSIENESAAEHGVPDVDPSPHDLDAPPITAQGRRLRKWLLLGNIVAWVLLLLAARTIFF